MRSFKCNHPGCSKKYKHLGTWFFRHSNKYHNGVCKAKAIYEEGKYIQEE